MSWFSRSASSSAFDSQGNLQWDTIVSHEQLSVPLLNAYKKVHALLPPVVSLDDAEPTKIRKAMVEGEALDLALPR